MNNMKYTEGSKTCTQCGDGKCEKEELSVDSVSCGCNRHSSGHSRHNAPRM